MNNHIVYIFIIFVILLLIVILTLIITKYYLLPVKECTHIIPKIIWTYWNDVNNIPVVVQKCIQTWKYNNPDYIINIIDYESLKSFIEPKYISKYYSHINLKQLQKDNFHQRIADYVRVLLLYLHGGIWMDASIICTESLEWVHSVQMKTDVDIIGFYAPHTTNMNFPILENWFFACKPKSNYVHDWLQEISYMTSFNDEIKYVEHIKKSQKYDMQTLEPALPYLVMHLCATVVHQRNPQKYILHMTRATDGPYKYLHENEWDAEKSLKALCNNPEMYNYPIIKFRGVERNYVVENNFNCKTTNKFVQFVFSSN